MLDLNNFQFGKVLGRSNNTVREAKDLTTNKTVAVKVMKIPKTEIALLQEIMNEALILAQCQHPNVVDCYGFSYIQKYDELEGDDVLWFYIFMEKMQKSLEDFIQERIKKKIKLSVDEAKEIFIDILEAMSYLQREGIAHRDIKPQNIMLSNDGKWKVVDIGSAKSVIAPALSTTRGMIGTIPYLSPEMLRASLKSEQIEVDPVKSDVFSLGLVFLYLSLFKDVTGLNSSDFEAQDKLTKNIDSVEQTFSPDFAYILKLMLSYDVSRRKTFFELKRITFLQGLLKTPYTQISDLRDEVQPLINRAKAKITEKNVLNALELLKRCIDIVNLYAKEELQKDEIKSQILNELISLSKTERDLHILEQLIVTMNQLGFPNNLAVSDVLFDLGSAFADLRYFDKAINAYNEALRIRVNILGEDTQRTGDLFYNLGVMYIQTNKFQDALQYLEKALKLRIKLNGDIHEKVSDTLHNIAFVYGELQKYDDSLQYYEKCKDTRSKLFGEEHEKTGDTYYNIGWTYFNKNDFEKALINLQRSKQIREKTLPETHEKLGDVYQYLGWTFLSQKNFESALLNFKNAYSIRSRIHGQFNDKTIYANQGIANTYFATQNYNLAFDVYKQILETLRSIPGITPTRYASIENKIRECAAKLGSGIAQHQTGK